MALLQDRERDVLVTHFSRLQAPVRLLVFDEPSGCESCQETHQLVEEIAGLSDKIETQFVDRVAEPEKATQYGVDKTPAIVLLRGGVEPRDTGIRFFGIPSGYEFASLVDDIVTVSRDEPELAPETLAWLGTLDRPIHLQVFVTPTCPYCPRAVILAHRLALASNYVRADMVEATEFPEMAQRYRVFGVPRTVINETVAIEGAVPESRLLDKLKSALTPAYAS
ncbi:MAG TPA: thioredoxin family protein [Chloroflexota bacterium]|nr:thioredoxin family protein [Chloroflexota bacterium]